jgi:hypothetical protein
MAVTAAAGQIQMQADMRHDNAANVRAVMAVTVIAVMMPSVSVVVSAAMVTVTVAAMVIVVATILAMVTSPVVAAVMATPAIMADLLEGVSIRTMGLVVRHLGTGVLVGGSDLGQACRQRQRGHQGNYSAWESR